MRPFVLAFPAHRAPSAAGDALSVFHAGPPLRWRQNPSACCNGNTAALGPDNHLHSPVVINISP